MSRFTRFHETAIRSPVIRLLWIEMWRIVRNNAGKWPADCLTFAFFIAEAIRLFSGAVLAYLFGKTGQVSGELGAFAIGVSAPLIIEKLTSILPSMDTSTVGGQT